ncbi:hypothetical protein ACE7GA_19235 [Roseomonas sp. CCTCC AB2023176]|uniref:hypothetical protein n=1 Tax=Roseomonas sp. CCTCC AB2023176 TaxID=3342640 RepID=UPI0035E106BF
MGVPFFSHISRAGRVLALTAALGTAACTDGYGRTDWGSTLALGAGLGLAAGAVAALASDNRDGHRQVRGQTRGRDYGYYGNGNRGYRGYAGGYGGWR